MNIYYRGRANYTIYGFYHRAHSPHFTSFSALIILLLGGFLPTAKAQQTLFNVLRTDVLDWGKVYDELDLSFKRVEPEFSSFVPRGVVGVGGLVEVGLNVTGNVETRADTTTLVGALKWKPDDGDSNGWAFVVGNNLFIPVRNRFYDVGNYAYAEFSKTFSTRTRLIAGFYYFTRNMVTPGAQRAGGQFGFDQPVTKRFTVQADWVTGHHANGYCTPGFSYKLSPKLTGYFRYSLGNTVVTGGNHFSYAKVGFNFK